MLLLTGTSVAVFMVLVTISIPLPTASAQISLHSKHQMHKVQMLLIAAWATSRVATVDNKDSNKGIETLKITLLQINSQT
jgi:hypothetical protein